MLQRHLCRTPVKIGIGANRANTAASFLKRYGHISPCKHGDKNLEKRISDNKHGNCSYSDQIGIAILDDGMQVCPQNCTLTVNHLLIELEFCCLYSVKLIHTS